MTTRTMARMLAVGLAAVIIAHFVLVFGGIQWRLYQNERAKQPLLEALRGYYPGVRFEGTASYERPGVRLRAYGVTDPAAQAEISDWLAGRKRELGLDGQVRLTFYDEKMINQLAVFEF